MTGHDEGAAEVTPLDIAHAAMVQAHDADDARLAFYARLGEVELFVPLLRESDGDRLDPQVFDTADGRFVLGFDRAERLAAFAEAAVPYAAVSGRAVARMLATAGDLGLGVNLGVAPSSILIPPGAIAWLVRTLDTAPTEVAARLREIRPPGDMPAGLLRAIDGKLASARGLAPVAYLTGVIYEGGAAGHMLAFVDALPGARAALAAAVAEALAFSGLDAGTIDVAFFDRTDPMAARLARTGLRFDLPQPAAASAPAPPGSDPARPPILR